MKIKKRTKIAAFILAAVLAVNLFGTQIVSAASPDETQTVTFSSASQNQSQTVTLPNGAKVTSATTDNGNVNYIQSGNQVTINVNDGKATTSEGSDLGWNTIGVSHYTSGDDVFNLISYNPPANPAIGNICTAVFYVSSGQQQGYTITFTYQYGHTGIYTTVTNYIYNVTLYYTTDTTPPTGSCSLSTTAWTKNNVIINVNATDTGSGVKSITAPNWTVTAGSSTTYTVTANGTYDFTLTDNNGNSCMYPVTVNNIDKSPPTSTYTLSKSTWTCHPVKITVTGSDSQSGVASIAMPNGSVTSGNTASYTVSDNGTYTFVITDNAGNTTSIPVVVSNIDKTVSVTHPLTVNYSYNPDTNSFSAPALTVQNNSPHIGMQTSIISMTTDGIKTVDPASVTSWGALTASQSASEIALGISNPTNGQSYWAGVSPTTVLGTAGTNSSMSFDLNARFGRSWIVNTSIKTTATFEFDAEDVA